jgi:hypothetical protein
MEDYESILEHYTSLINERLTEVVKARGMKLMEKIEKAAPRAGETGEDHEWEWFGGD